MSSLIIQSIWLGQVESSLRGYITIAILKNFTIFSAKYLCWSLFLIKNFNPTLFKRDSSIGSFLWMFQNFWLVTCLEKHLRTAASVRCYFDTINLNQYAFCTTHSFKILISERKYKNSLKNGEYQNIDNNYNNNNNINCHIYVHVMFYYVMLWFYQNFKSENLKVVNTGLITRDHVESPQMRNSKGFSFGPQQILLCF